MTNPFLLSSIEDQQPKPAEANPYSLQAIESDQRQDLRNTLTGAVRENPDAAAEAARLAKRYPAPVDVLARNLQDVKLQEMVDKADETLKTSPKLAEYLRTKPWTTQQSHDDIEPLSAVEQVFNVVRSVPAGAARGLGGIASGTGELLDIGARATGLSTLSRLVREATGIDPNVALDVAGSFKVLGKGGKAIADAIGVDPANRNFATDVGEGIGQLLQQIGVQIATGGTASLATLFAQGADAMSTKTEKDNASQAMRDTAVLTGSAITALTEKYGVDALLNRVPPKIKNDALRWVADKLVAGGIEATQEITEGVLQDLVRVALTNPDAEVGEGLVYEAGVAGTAAAIVRAALGVRVRSNVEVQRANEAQQHAQKLQEAMTVAAQSKLRERNPETFRDLAATLTDNTTVYVDAQVLAQSAAELAEALPAVAEQLEGALASNSTVEVPIADILTLAPGTPLEQVFLQNARSAPDAMSLADADQAGKQAEQFLQQEAERVLQQAADTQAWQASSEAVRTEILGQLNSTGRFTADVNEAYATLQSNFFSTMAARTGLTPTELYQRYNLKVAAKQAGQGGVLNTGSESLRTVTPGDTVDGRVVREGIPNRESIRSSLDNFTVLPGVREVPMSAFDPEYISEISMDTLDGRTRRLAEEIQASGEITPLIVVQDAQGVYVLEGGHRFDALIASGAQSLPALVVIDQSNPPGQALTQSATIRRGTETLKKYGLTPGKSYKTREVAAALEARQRAKYGTIADDDRSPEALAKISKWMQAEVEFAMDNPESSGVGWYSEKFQRALDTMAQQFPELATDKVARDTMTALIAITSDGQKVVPNFAQAMDIYGRFREGGETAGKFTTTRGTQRQASVDNNLAVIQRLYDQMGAEAMHQYLMQEKTISELKKLAKANGGELKSDYQAHIKMPMAAVEFGPKLGAFYANLMGAHGYLTMDRWWSRSFNRYRGTLLQAPTRQGLDRFKELLGNPALSDDEAIAATVEPRNAYAAKGFKKGTELEKAANTIYKAAFENLEDSPFNATDRTFMLDAVNKAQQALKRKGYNLSVADIQAILWYYEKRLYGELGARQTADISYEEAAQRVVAGYASGSGIESLLDDTGAAPEDGGADRGRVPVGEETFNAGDVNGQLEQAGDRAGRAADAGSSPLPGAPIIAGATGPDPRLVAVAEQYARDNGIDLKRQAEYVQVDPERAARIAAAYEAMAHAPQDPAVKEAYENLIQQTVAQYRALEAAGYKFWFIDPTNDPYKSPFDAMREMRASQTMGVFPTVAGFGSGATDVDITDNPLMGDTGIQWPYGSLEGELKPVLANDLFRAVHDAFGHGLEGAGFRAQGEENAWQAHIRLFTGSAQGAITSETRGQNSWLNFGPFGETNQTAKVEDTVFADQKTGLMPAWTWSEGRAGDMQDDGVFNQFAGPNAKTADKLALSTAQQRLDAGEDAETVRKETGWFKGTDGKWRFEIDDTNATFVDAPKLKAWLLGEKPGRKGLNAADARELKKLKPQAEDLRDQLFDIPVADRQSAEFDALFEKYTSVNDRVKRLEGRSEGRFERLGDVLDHPALFAAYPEIANYTVTLRVDPTRKSRADGFFNQDQQHIYLETQDFESMLDSLLHEVQHGIQSVEGFAMGGSVKTDDASLPAGVVAQIKQLNEAADAASLKADFAEARRLREESNKLRANAGFEQYQKLAGEVESRNVERRRKMTAAEREATPPSATADVADSDVIVVFNGKEMQSAPMPANATPLLQGPRGTFSPSQLLLTLNENADLSTFLHESGHFFLEVMADLASQPNAPQQIKDDMAATLKWFGVPDLATWNSYTLDQKRPYHERWAESFEQYLFEGKAPSPELQPLFRRFRSWLVNVYKSLTQFMRARDLKLNDEVRQVFDRLIATDEQIAQAEEAAGMLPDFDATNEAIEQLQARSLRDLKWTVKARGKVLKALEKEAKTLRKEVEAEVRAEVEQQPVYRAMRFFTRGELDDQNQTNKQRRILDTTAGGSTKLDLAALKEIYGDGPAAPWRYLSVGKNGLAGKEGLHPDLAADMFGFESGDKLVRAILDAEPIGSVIEGMTDQRMLERHGDLATPEALEAAANEAVHNEARARSLATELKSQAEMLNPRQDTGRTASNGRAITVNAITAAAKQFAANLAARRRIKDLKNAAWQHRSAEARAGKAWADATAKGKTEEAVQAKRDQVLNNAAVKALQDAQGEVKQIVEFFKRVVKGNDEKIVERGRDPDVVNAMRAILAAYDVAPRLEKSALAYMETVAKNDPAMYAALQPSVQGAMLNAKPMVEMTMEELRGLHDELRAMWVLAKRSRQMEVDGNLLDIEDAADQLLERMGEIGIPDTIPGEKGAITDKQERGIKLQFAKAILSRVEQWSERLDGKFGGPFLRLVFQPVKDAADRYRTDKVAYRQKFTELLKNVAPYLPAGPIEAPELGYTFGNARDSGAAELLHAILHTGNDSNKRKLLLGRGWATQDAEGNLDTTRWDNFIQRLASEGKLNQAHFQFAQGVWDLLEEMKPLAQETHRKVFGRYFAEVTANEFVDPFGNVWRGGYLPAQTDSRLVKDAKLRELAEGENESMAYAFPAAPSGFTKSRVEYNQPLLLDLRALGQHMDKVLLFSHMQGAVTDVRRLLTNKRVSYALDRIDPGAYEGMLIPWLNRSARQVVETPVVGDRKLSRFLSAARSRAGMALMFANLSNTVQQITGFTMAGVKVKPGLIMSATARFMADPKAMKTTVADSSPYMKDRMLNEVGAMNDAIEEILIDPTLLERGQAWTQRHAYFMQAAVDNTMSPIIWTAAYNQGVEQGMEDKDAVRFADGVIRQTQGTTLPEDISRFESGPGYARLFTQFVSYFNMMANTNATAVKQIADEVGLKKGAGKMLYVAIAGLLAPIWVAEAIAQAFRGGPEDEDKDGWLDDWLMAVFGLGTLRGLTAQVPIVGQAAQLVINRFNDNPADDKFSLSPAVSLIESTVSAPSSVYKAIVEDGNKQKAVRDVAAAATMITGLPIYGVARPIGYLAGIAGGNIEPTGPVDLARGVVTGTASPESKAR